MNRDLLNTYFLSGSRVGLGGNEEKSKIHSLSLRMSQSNATGKHAANYNDNVLNDNIKI